MTITRTTFVRGMGAAILGSALVGPALASAAEKASAASSSRDALGAASSAKDASASAFYERDEPGSVVADAVLYRVTDDGELEYDVVHAAPVGADVVVSDETGSGIATLEDLLDVMGAADAPATVLSVDPGTRTIGKCVHADLTLSATGEVASIAVTAVSDRPVVGISWKKDEIGDDYQGFAQAFERNGAIAVYMPQVGDAAGAQEALAAIDGLFETGGEDWNPALYGEEQTPHGSSGWNDARDTSDIAYMTAAVQMDLPLLTVCRGTQGLNVALGGALIQDIPSYLAQKVLDGEIDPSRATVISGTLPATGASAQDTGYRMYDAATGEFVKTYDKDTGQYVSGSGCDGEGHLRVQVDGIVHSGGTGYHELDPGYDGIGVAEDSAWLYDIVGADTVSLVATAHHQAIDPDRLGDGLTIVASSSDGIVEAVEHQASSFVLGLQWHPERDALGDTRGVDVDNDLCNAFLAALVAHALERVEQGAGGAASSAA